MSTDHPSLSPADDSQLSDVNREITKTYDTQVYTSNAFSFSAPRHLRAAAHLYGLESVPLKQARVLELGCAGGGNLLPFAVAHPEAHVVGVDLSSVQIAQGQELVRTLGLQNLHLHAMSLTDITPDFGQFDYIIAHGVFSWVPPEVRQAMLRILRENLSPNGIGYISYNTYPGWKAGDIVRDAMLLHSHGLTSEADRLASAKAVLGLLSDGIAAGNRLAPSLRAAVQQLSQHSDYYIAHEYLEIFNNPCYLLEFVDLANQQGLTHVGDADPSTEMSVTYGQNVQLHHSLIALGQPREMRQQYLDFAVGRNFRKSLLVHQARAASIHSPDLARIADLRWAGCFTEEAADPAMPKGLRTFSSLKKSAPLQTQDANLISILQALTQAWPASLDITALTEHVRTTQSLDEPEARKHVLDALETLFYRNSLHFALEATPYDSPTPLARSTPPALIPGLSSLLKQQTQGASSHIGTFNLWHDSVALRTEGAEAFVISHIDGNTHRKQLSTLLRDAWTRGTLPGPGGKSLKGQRNLDALADKLVDSVLDTLRKKGWLY